jgi:hypothetical protein
MGNELQTSNGNHVSVLSSTQWSQLLHSISTGISPRQLAAEYAIDLATLMEALQGPDYAQDYQRARKAMADLAVWDSISIADEIPSAYTDIGRAKNRIQVRQWLAERLDPQSYGAKTQGTQDITVRPSIDLSRLSDDELKQYQHLTAAAQLPGQ